MKERKVRKYPHKWWIYGGLYLKNYKKYMIYNFLIEFKNIYINIISHNKIIKVK